MSLILRFFLTLIKARCRSKLHPFDTALLPMNVWPNDLDLLFHMNNGRLLSLMDLGQIDLLVRTGFWDEARKRKRYPVVGTPIDYKRPLTVFQAYELRTKLIGWDDRWIYVEQQFIRGSAMAARATLKTMMRSYEGAVTPSEALSMMDLSEISPALPDYVELMAHNGRGREFLV